VHCETESIRHHSRIVSDSPQSTNNGQQLDGNRLRDTDKSTVIGNQQSLVINRHWQSTIIGNQQSLAINSHWQSTVIGNQQSLAINSH